MNRNAPRAEWSRTRWTVTIGLLFFLQLGALYRGAVVPPAPETPGGTPTAMAWLTDPTGLEWVATADWISSPRQVVALEDGAFSRAAERSLPRTSYQLFEWDLPPRWLETRAGRWFPTVDPDRDATGVRPENPARILSGAAPLPLRTASRLEIDAAGAERLVDGVDGLPDWRAPEISGPSRVEALVGPGGLVLSVRLRESSGHAPADQAALDRARGLRFRPIPPVDGASPWDADRVQWVDLRFRWRLLPAVPGSNAVPPAVR